VEPRYLESLFQKYKSRGVVIDANLLLLYFVGSHDPGLISRYKRTRVYSEDDYYLLKELIDYFDRIITTPNILTEVSNLSGQLGEPIRQPYFDTFKQKVSILDETYCAATEACRCTHFNRVGLTDAVIMQISEGQYLVITDDFPLAGILGSMNMDVINFNHLRRLKWG